MQKPALRRDKLGRGGTAGADRWSANQPPHLSGNRIQGQAE
jgi:hypothetical protein